MAHAIRNRDRDERCMKDLLKKVARGLCNAKRLTLNVCGGLDFLSQLTAIRTPVRHPTIGPGLPRPVTRIEAGLDGGFGKRSGRFVREFGGHPSEQPTK